MRSTLTPIVTPESHPDHDTVGHDFMGHSFAHGQSARYYCRSYDAAGFNMVNRADPEDDKNVSERAIGRTFHIIRVSEPFEDGTVTESSRWGPCLIGKDGQPRASHRIMPDA